MKRRSFLAMLGLAAPIAAAWDANLDVPQQDSIAVDLDSGKTWHRRNSGRYYFETAATDWVVCSGNAGGIVYGDAVVPA